MRKSIHGKQKPPDNIGGEDKPLSLREMLDMKHYFQCHQVRCVTSNGFLAYLIGMVVEELDEQIDEQQKDILDS